MNYANFSQLIFTVNKLYTEKTNDNLKEYTVTRSDMSLLIKLKEDGKMTQKELAEAKNLNTATVARALDRLEKKGFVKRESNMKDKRKKNIVLTEKGIHIISEILIKHENFKKDIFKEFDDEDYLQLVKYLEMLSASLKYY